ncbi:MAG: DNA primase [Pirellulaceae bacterium]
MSFTFDSDTKERVRAATDIVDLIGSRLELRRQGRNFVALCPWHKDSRPSLQVNPEKQIWKCWVCDIGGDVFNYIMQDSGLSFQEALRELANRAGIELTQRSHSGKKQPSGPDIKAEMYRALAWAEELYHQHLLESPAASQARDYLAERGISSSSINKFGIGMAPDAWSTLLDGARSKKLSPHVLESAGLVIKRDQSSGHYDRFRNRIMFPIRDRESHVIAFGGRAMPGSEEKAKYINSPETRLFQKHQQLYGLDLAYSSIRRSKQALIMEGYTDVIVANQFGIDNAVAVLGTAVGAAHLKLLRHLCDTVVLLLDGDEAGQRRSDEVLELFLHAQLDMRVLSLPDGQDPADFLLQRGSEPLKQLIQNSVDAFEFKLRRVSAGFDPLVDTHRANAAIESMLDLLAKVPTEGLISNEAFRLRQNQVLPRLARQFSVPEQSLRERLSQMRSRQSRFKRKAREDDRPAVELIRPGDLQPFERELLELIIVAPQVAPIALERVQSGWLECEAARAMFDAYQQLEFSGESLEFTNVLNALENSSLKSLLVTLHEQATAKLHYTRDSAEHRLRVLTQRMGERQDALRRQREMDSLVKGLPLEEEIDILQQIVRQARLRQGLVDPPAGMSAATQAAVTTETTTKTGDDVPPTRQSPPR